MSLETAFKEPRVSCPSEHLYQSFLMGSITDQWGLDPTVAVSDWMRLLFSQHLFLFIFLYMALIRFLSHGMLGGYQSIRRGGGWSEEPAKIHTVYGDLGTLLHRSLGSQNIG